MQRDLEKNPSRRFIVEDDQRYKTEKGHPQQFPSEDHRHLQNPFSKLIANPTPRTERMDSLRKECVIAVLSPCFFSSFQDCH
jgi:hypothetical protein